MAERKYLVREGLLREAKAAMGARLFQIGTLKSTELFKEYQQRVAELDAILAQPPASDEPSGDELLEWMWMEAKIHWGDGLVAHHNPENKSEFVVTMWNHESDESIYCYGESPRAALLAAYRKSKEQENDRA